MLGVDMGATSVDIALANFRGDVLARHNEPIDVRDGPEPVLGRVVEIAQSLIARVPGSGEALRSIGIGVPGPVDFANGTLNVPPIMPGWERYPIRPKIQETFPHTTVVVDNDVNIMALGELRAGTGKGVDHFVFVKVGTGIGAGSWSAADLPWQHRKRRGHRPHQADPQQPGLPLRKHRLPRGDGVRQCARPARRWTPHKAVAAQSSRNTSPLE